MIFSFIYHISSSQEYYFDDWTVFSTLIQFIHELAHRSLWLVPRRGELIKSQEWPKSLCQQRKKNLMEIHFQHTCSVLKVDLHWIFLFSVDVMLRNTFLASTNKISQKWPKLIFSQYYQINLGFWETAHPPLPKPTFCSKWRSKC